jgi:Rrf2 family nitric oxide-sensitive transcriptional repressor
MKLTTFTDYSLRVLMYLALEPERLGTIQGIADAYDISANHLMKVVHHLAKSGFIESVRGKGGGIRLARPAKEIRLGAIVRDTEGDDPEVECFGEHNQCCIAPNCNLAGVLARAFAGLYSYLDQYTLADLVKQRESLVQVLHMTR